MTAMRAHCKTGGDVHLTSDTVWLWTDERQVGFGFWCPHCQVQHRKATTPATAILLIDHGSHVTDFELFPEAA